MLDPAIAPLIDDAKARLNAAFDVGEGPLADTLVVLTEEISPTLAHHLGVLAQAEQSDTAQVADVQIAHARLVRLMKKPGKPTLSPERLQARLMLFGKAAAACILVAIAMQIVW